MPDDLPDVTLGDLEARLREHAATHGWEIGDDQLRKAAAFMCSTKLAFDGRCYIDLETKRLCVRARSKAIVLAAADPEDQAELNEIVAGTASRHIAVLAGIVPAGRGRRDTD